MNISGTNEKIVELSRNLLANATTEEQKKQAERLLNLAIKNNGGNKND